MNTNSISFKVNYRTVVDVESKVQAIRALRNLVDIGLKEAKETFEQQGKIFTFAMRSNLIDEVRKINISTLMMLTDDLSTQLPFAADAERILRDLAVRGVEAGHYDLVRRLMDLLESRTWN